MLRQLSWSRLVDIVTIIWLIIFILGFFASPALADALRMANITILSVFVVDLWVSYRKVRSLPIFLKRHWLDILMVIPYFRIFRVARILRLARFIRIARGVKIVRSAKIVKAVKTVKLAKFAKVSVIMHETADLLRTAKSRLTG